MSLRPLLSVIIPTHNARQFLPDALASVAGQNYEPHEVILVDDGSTDGTGAWVQEFAPHVRYFAQPNQGPAAARNRGLAEARGSYVAFLDADDVWTPRAIATLVQHLEARPELLFVLGLTTTIRIRPGADGWETEQTLIESWLTYMIHAAVYRREVFDTVGRFAPELRYGEDTDWFARARELRTPFTAVPETVLIHRRHGSNMTNGRNAEELNVVKVLKRSIERRRLVSAVALPLPPVPVTGAINEGGSAPRVSVVIPAYNAERFLGEAIASVLRQQSDLQEIIVVDDGSSDRTAKVARRFPGVRRLSQANAGPGAARNRGVAAATGEYLAFLDADDLWLPGKLPAQLALLAEQPEVQAVFGGVEQFVEPEFAARGGRKIEIPQTEQGLLAGAMLIRRADFLRMGEFRTDLRAGEFIDWYARATAAGLRVAHLPQVVLRRRIHGDNLGLRHPDARHDFLKLLRDHLDRRRAGRSAA